MKKTILVTGASRGIGKAVALKYAKKGYNIAISCVSNEKQLAQTKKEAEGYQANCLAYVGDMGDYAKAEELFGQIHKQFGGVDIVVNNAGISYVGLLQDMKVEDWNHIMQANLTSLFNCSKLGTLDMLKKGGGKMVNISSVWGVAGASMEVAYSAAKGGMNAFTRALAKELAPSNIQVNAIACGVIDTEMNDFLSDEELFSLLEEIPAGRMGTAEEVADLVYNLTHKSNYLTGQVVSLDGGWI